MNTAPTAQPQQPLPQEPLPQEQPDQNHEPPTETAFWLDPQAKETPIWLRTLYASMPVAAVFILHGQIHDLHPIPVNGRMQPDTTVNAIWHVLDEYGFGALLTFDPLNGLRITKTGAGYDENAIRDCLNSRADRAVVSSLLRTSAQRAAEAHENPYAGDVSFAGMDAIAEAVAQSDNPAMALLIDYTSQVRESQNLDTALNQLMLASLALADAHAVYNERPVRFPRTDNRGLLRHPVIWLVDDLSDLPNWLAQNDGIRQISIGRPDVDSRVRMARRLLDQAQFEENQLEAMAQRFADASEGLSSRGMFESFQLARSSPGDGPLDIERAVRTYREGLSDNPWQSARLKEQLADGENVLKQRVLGQDAAVDKVLDILKRSALGMTGAHQRKPVSQPRGILYFAGPTGVGKTEMAKAIAELVFADEQALIRFDMSEFQDDHAKIRLVGAPPSYVGYGSGGELTNAVNQRPHSIILFDEMDKAGAEVNDLFLQILSDGRLSDGSGRTTSFSECLIIFTSNQGVATHGDVLKMDMSIPQNVERYEQVLGDAVREHFRTNLGRPEILGRLGDNIVIFRPMQGQVAVDLANRFIDTILSNTLIRVGNEVTIADSARAELVSKSTSASVLENGARGITMELESLLVNPLGRRLFDSPSNSALHIEAVTKDAHGQPDLQVSIL